MTLKGAIIRAVQHWKHWPDATDTDCPVKFDQGELNKFMEDEKDWVAMCMMEELWMQRVCGMTGQGWVTNETYEKAKIELEQLTREIRQECEGDEGDIQAFNKGWPFRDREEEVN